MISAEIQRQTLSKAFKDIVPPAPKLEGFLKLVNALNVGVADFNMYAAYASAIAALMMAIMALMDVVSSKTN